MNTTARTWPLHDLPVIVDNLIRRSVFVTENPSQIYLLAAAVGNTNEAARRSVSTTLNLVSTTLNLASSLLRESMRVYPISSLIDNANIAASSVVINACVLEYGRDNTVHITITTGKEARLVASLTVDWHTCLVTVTKSSYREVHTHGDQPLEQPVKEVLDALTGLSEYIRRKKPNRVLFLSGGWALAEVVKLRLLIAAACESTRVEYVQVPAPVIVKPDDLYIRIGSEPAGGWLMSSYVVNLDDKDYQVARFAASAEAVREALTLFSNQEEKPMTQSTTETQKENTMKTDIEIIESKATALVEFARMSGIFVSVGIYGYDYQTSRSNMRQNQTNCGVLPEKWDSVMNMIYQLLSACREAGLNVSLSANAPVIDADSLQSVMRTVNISTTEGSTGVPFGQGSLLAGSVWVNQAPAFGSVPAGFMLNGAPQQMTPPKYHYTRPADPHQPSQQTDKV